MNKHLNILKYFIYLIYIYFNLIQSRFIFYLKKPNKINKISQKIIKNK